MKIFYSRTELEKIKERVKTTKWDKVIYPLDGTQIKEDIEYLLYLVNLLEEKNKLNIQYIKELEKTKKARYDEIIIHIPRID